MPPKDANSEGLEQTAPTVYQRPDDLSKNLTRIFTVALKIQIYFCNKIIKIYLITAILWHVASIMSVKVYFKLI